MINWESIKEKFDLELFHNVFHTFIKNVKDNYFIFLTILGAIFFIQSFFSAGRVKEALFGLGSLILISGVFAALSKWLIVQNILKKELLDILYGKEHLNKQSMFDDIFKKLVKTAINKNLPDLEPHLHDTEIKKLLPSEGASYYKDYLQILEVINYDKNLHIVTLKETLSIKIGTSSIKEHTKPFKLIASYKSEPLNNTIEVLNLDDKDILGIVTSERDDENKEETISYNLSLKGKTEYDLYRVMTRSIDLINDPLQTLVFGSHSLRPRIIFKSGEGNVFAKFMSTGTLEDFVTLAGSNNTAFFDERYPELMLTGQGYLLLYSIDIKLDGKK